MEDSFKRCVSRNDPYEAILMAQINRQLQLMAEEDPLLTTFMEGSLVERCLRFELDFESKIMAKTTAPELLRRELAAPRWKPQVLAMSGVTDCYQPIERQLKITRGCLEVLVEFRNPNGIITKNHLVTRDIDLLQELHRYDASAVYVSLTTLDSHLARILEPRASSPQLRLETIEALAQAKIPVGVMVAPVIPAINDTEIPAILKAAAQAGAQTAGFVLVRLPFAVKELFATWLETYFPDRAHKVLHRLEAMRGGRLNDPGFGSRMRGEGIFAEQIENIFQLSARKNGFSKRSSQLSKEHFRRPGDKQMNLF